LAEGVVTRSLVPPAVCEKLGLAFHVAVGTMSGRRRWRRRCFSFLRLDHRQARERLDAVFRADDADVEE